MLMELPGGVYVVAGETAASPAMSVSGYLEQFARYSFTICTNRVEVNT